MPYILMSQNCYGLGDTMVVNELAGPTVLVDTPSESLVRLEHSVEK